MRETGALSNDLHAVEKWIGRLRKPMRSKRACAPAMKRVYAALGWRDFARPLFVHQSLMEYANESFRHSLWARAFYQMQKAVHKTHWVIIRALAYKWIRILFRCWQERIPYDELRYLKSLQRSSSPLLHFLAESRVSAFTRPNPPPMPHE